MNYCDCAALAAPHNKMTESSVRKCMICEVDMDLDKVPDDVRICVECRYITLDDTLYDNCIESTELAGSEQDNISTTSCDDDPPKDLYMHVGKDPSPSECEDNSVFEDEIYAYEDEYCLDLDNEEFDIYDHFGIPSDVSSERAEAMLEAAMGSS